MSAVCSAARSVGEWAARYRATAMRMCRPSSVFSQMANCRTPPLASGRHESSRLPVALHAQARRSAPAGNGRARDAAPRAWPQDRPVSAVEGVEQGDPDRLLIGRQIVGLLVALAWNAGRRDIEVACEIESHRAVQDTPNGGDVATRGRASDPLEHPVERVGVGEDVMRRLPVGVLVGVAEAGHPKSRPVSERSAEVCRNGALTDCSLDRVDDPGRIIAQQLYGERRVVRSATRAAVCREQLRHLRGRFVAERNKIDRLARFGRFLCAARRHHLADDGWQQRGRMLPTDQV